MPRIPHDLDKPRARPHILIVDDEVFIRNALELYFEANDYRVTIAKNGDEAIELFSKPDVAVDIAILDLVMPGTHGLDVLQHFKRVDPSVEVIIATGCGSMGNAVEALRFGAFDYITKPILDFDEDLLRTVERALDARRAALDARRAVDPPLADDAPARARAPQSAPAPLAPSNWLAVYEHMNRLAARASSRTSHDESVVAVWPLISQGFGADGALVVRADGDTTLVTEHAWGFVTPPRPNDLFDLGDDGRDPASLARPPAAGFAHASLWNLTRRPFSARALAQWAGIVQVPFHGWRNEPRLLLLFYRSPSAFDLDSCPLSLLSALLTWRSRAADLRIDADLLEAPLATPRWATAKRVEPEEARGGV